MIHSVYLAGKITAQDHKGYAENDWREDITEFSVALDITDYSFDILSPDYCWPSSHSPGLILGELEYTGPYLLSRNHAGFLGPHQHASGLGYSQQSRSDCERRLQGLCFGAIRASDLFFAWITDLTCFGTLAELGYAHAIHKQIWIAGPKRFPDLWFAYQMAQQTCFAYESPRSAFEALYQAHINLTGNKVSVGLEF